MCKKYFKAKEFDNIKDIIYNSAKEYKDRTAFVIKHIEKGELSYENISYTKLLEDINSLGSAFYSLGLKGKRIAVIGKNRYEWVITYLSSLLGSIVAIPLDKDLQFEELENSLIRSKADAIVFDKKLLGLIQKIENSSKTQIKDFICMEEVNDYICINNLIQKGKEILETGNKEFINNKIEENEMNVMLFTSGTTSKSKAVMLSQKNIASNIYSLQCVEDIRKTDTNIALLPFHHVFGGACLLVMLACGAKTVFTDGLRYIKQNMKEYGVSVFVGVPILTAAMYKAILKKIENKKKKNLVRSLILFSNILLKLHIDIRRKIFKTILDELGGNLRLVITGGAPADIESVKGFYEFGVDILQGYGLSETSPVISAEDYYSRKLGSVGIPMNNLQVKIDNKDENEIGEIKVKGPSVMLGYYEMPELTHEVLKDGWFSTGDLGYIDKKGFLYITGRNKNLIVLKNGKKVFPEELETVLNRIDLINECMVFGMKNEFDENDVTVSVKIVYNEDAIKENYKDKTEEQLRKIVWDKIKQVNQTFPRYKHVQKLITSHEELIKTTTKKIRRQEELELIMSKEEK